MSKSSFLSENMNEWGNQQWYILAYSLAMLVASLVTILVILTASCIRYPCCPSTYIGLIFENQCAISQCRLYVVEISKPNRLSGKSQIMGDFPLFDLPLGSCSSNMDDYQTANDSVKYLAHTCTLSYQAPGIPHSDLNPSSTPSSQNGSVDP